MRHPENLGTWGDLTEGFLLHLPGRIQRLQKACEMYLESPHDPRAASFVLFQAKRLADACAAYGHGEMVKACRSIMSLCRMAPDEVFGVEELLRERMEDLLALLDEIALDLGILAD